MQTIVGKPDNAEQMGELIQILLGQRNADFKIFCRMLRQSNNALWANELERTAKQFREQSGRQCTYNLPYKLC